MRRSHRMILCSDRPPTLPIASEKSKKPYTEKVRVPVIQGFIYDPHFILITHKAIKVGSGVFVLLSSNP